MGYVYKDAVDFEGSTWNSQGECDEEVDGGSVCLSNEDHEY